jgi:hypothetical protein
MILRAIFWISVVAVLMPREPDLGLGRPSATAPAARDLQASSQIDCKAYAKACTTAFSLLDTFQSVAVRGLADVKADIEHQQKTAGARSQRDD